MNARNQVLVVLTALLMVCSSGAMVVGASGSGSGSGATVAEQPAGEQTTAETQAQTQAQAQNDTQNETGDEPVAIEPDTDDADGDGQQPAYVTFEDQTTQGQTVVVDEVSMANGGFVAIHDSSLLTGNVIGSVIGSSTYLEAGTHENVEITLDEPLGESETLVAMPHRDTNDNQEYDFVEQEGQADGPYTDGGQPITDQAVVTVGQAEEPVDQTPNETDEQPVDQEPNETDDQPVEQEPIGEEPNETDDQPVEQEPIGEEPNETDEQPVEQEPIGEEPNETDEQPVEQEPIGEVPNETDDQPVDQEPIGEEPEEEPADVPDEIESAINVNIEQANIFVLLGDGQHTGDTPMQDGDMPIGADGDGDDVLDENTTDVGESNVTDTVNESDIEGVHRISLGEQTVLIVVDDAQMADGENVTENETEMAVRGQVNVTIERANIYVIIGGADEMPAEEEPAEVPIEEPVGDEPVDEEPNVTEPIGEEPNVTDEEPNVTEPEEPNITEPEEPNITEPEEPNITEPEEPNVTEPIDEEPNVTDEQPADEEAQPFVVDELEAPSSAEVGETVNVTATITNPSETEATQEVQFRLDGDLLATEDMTIDGGESEEITFSLDTNGLEAGTYVHMVLTEESGAVDILELTQGDGLNQTDNATVAG
ncbi:Ig-like domain-containing protein [Halopiger thermotolerans]